MRFPPWGPLGESTTLVRQRTDNTLAMVQGGRLPGILGPKSAMIPFPAPAPACDRQNHVAHRDESACRRT